jgi:hypothetical protein
MTFGTFIDPDTDLETLEDPNEKLSIPIYSGFRAVGQAHAFTGRNRIFDRIWNRWNATPLTCEDQCSGKYYFDLVSTLRDFNGEFGRLVEVGVYMGGASSIFGGCIAPFDFDLDLVDIEPRFLHYAYERIRRTFPESVDRVRLFHGDLPSYVNAVMLREPPVGTVVHHDGAHDFNQVVKDMASLYYAREQLFAVIAQDTHLRGTVDNMNFVDMALYAVFGHDLNYAPIGAAYPQQSGLTNPNIYQGNYFRPDAPEGFVLPMSVNRFDYPHPSLTIDQFLPEPKLAAVA